LHVDFVSSSGASDNDLSVGVWGETPGGIPVEEKEKEVKEREVVARCLLSHAPSSGGQGLTTKKAVPSAVWNQK